MNMDWPMFKGSKFVWLLLFSSTSSYSLSPNGYYDIHQAVGYLEAYANGSCAQGKRWSAEFVRNLDKQPPEKPLSNFISAIKDRLNREKLELADLEQFRLDLHLKAEGGGYKHSTKWHDEIVNRCRSSDGGKGANILSSLELLTSGEILFECTILEVTSSDMQSKTVPKIKKYTTIRMDATREKSALIQIGNFKETVAQAAIHRNKLPDTEKFKIYLKDSYLFLYLKGKPLSRDGDFSLESVNGQLRSWGRVTCH